jgi:hypothetical protein
MRRGILLISIFVTGMILILSAAMLSYIFRHSDTKGLNIINSTGGSDGHQPHQIRKHRIIRRKQEHRKHCECSK